MPSPLIYHAIPTYGTNISMDWAMALSSLQFPLGGSLVRERDASEPFSPGGRIDEKRNNLVKRGLGYGAKFFLFQGDDVILPDNFVLNCLARIRQGYRVVTGVYWRKSHPPEPYIWKEMMQGPYYDWHQGDFFEIDWAGCDAMMVDAKVFEEIGEPYFNCDYRFSATEGKFAPKTEDIWFYDRCHQKGIKTWCDSGMQCPHWERGTNKWYVMPTNWACAQSSGTMPKWTGKLVLDVGAGYGTNQTFFEGKVIRLDIDPDAKPDILGDVRGPIPEPNDKFDEVHASHILEHLTAEEGIPALREWIRVLKPGGKLIVIVPDILGICKRIGEGALDAYNWWTLFGIQYNQWQQHKWGYTEPLLRTVLQNAGNLRDITITTEQIHLTMEPDKTCEQLLAIAYKDKSSQLPVLSGFPKEPPKEQPAHMKKSFEELKKPIEDKLEAIPKKNRKKKSQSELKK